MGELRIVGGDVALDLVNTIEPRITGQEPERDHLRSPAALLHWAERAGVLTASDAEQVARSWDESPDLAVAEFALVLRLRTAIGTAVDAAREHTHGAAEAEALAVVVEGAASALARTALVPDPEGGRPARREVGVQPAHRISDRLALDALEMLESADLNRLRACPPDDGGCGWVFLDTSKNGTRRWCSMEDCGTHAKSRRLTERRRQQRVLPIAPRA